MQIEKLVETINSIQIRNDRTPLKAFSAEVRLREDLGFDSLDLAELTAKIDHEFGVDIFSAGNVFTLSDILSRLEK
jgi:acyl carrier protein